MNPYSDYHNINVKIDNISIEDVVYSIITLNSNISRFWTSSQGWAPLEAAQLLSKSRLDWQVSLSYCLRLWINIPLEDELEGKLILAWANLGSLVEGSMKWFLSVYYCDYRADIDAFRRRGDFVEPDDLTLEPLRVFFQKRIWGDESTWNDWVTTIQMRRNAIHAFRSRDIGTFADFHSSLKMYLLFLRQLDDGVPYPDFESGMRHHY